MKIIKSLFKLYKRFDLWLHKDRNGPGELYDTTSYKGAVNLIMLGLIGATILLLLPEILNESNEAKKNG